MSCQNLGGGLQIPTTNSNVNILDVTSIAKVVGVLPYMSEVFMKESLMNVAIVRKVLLINQLSKSMWKLFMWIWRISNAMNVTNHLDKIGFFNNTLQLSIEMRRSSNVIIARKLLVKMDTWKYTWKESTKCKKCDFCMKTFWYVICQQLTAWNFFSAWNKKKPQFVRINMLFQTH